jgi:galactosamine-6-phosphate isomerase
MATVHRFRNYDELSTAAAAQVISAVTAKSDSLICAAAGSSPAGVYRELVREAQSRTALFGKLRVVKLDEWLGLPPDDPAACEFFLKRSLIDPLAISRERYIAFDAQTDDPARECGRVQAELDRQGPIDLCVLGFGRNGHVGLNEPGVSAKSHCHVATLSVETLGHAMLSASKASPTHGMTLGIADLLAARKILLLVTGAGKEQALAKFLEGTSTPEVPASLLWPHPALEIFLDESLR